MANQVFISYSGHDQFEARMLQFAIETILAQLHVTAWTYQRDQELSESRIAVALKQSVRDSTAMIFLVSPQTLEGGAAQWIELGYADAFEVKTFVLLHHLEYDDLKHKKAPPLLLASQCNSVLQWQDVIEDIRELIGKDRLS